MVASLDRLWEIPHAVDQLTTIADKNFINEFIVRIIQAIRRHLAPKTHLLLQEHFGLVLPPEKSLDLLLEPFLFVL